MEKKKKTFLPPFVLLCLVAIVMSAAISGVYTLTKDTIDAAALAAQEEARRAVMTEAVSMTEMPLEEGASVDYCYEAFDASGSSIGYISQITVMGFGGEIEVTVGMDRSGAITAIRVGGANFAETSGLGAKTRDAAFTDQFAGKSGMLILKQNIDSVTGASVSSSAVVGGVNRSLTYMAELLPAAPVSDVEEIELTAEELLALVSSGDTLTWMGGGDGIDGWWQLASGGYIVRATGFGLGPIVVTMAFDADGAVTAILIGDENFMESAGYGARVQEEAYWGQFIGRSGQQAYGDDLDGISGASTTANATLEAINACMTFDPENPGTVAAAAPAAEPVTETASGEPSREPADPDPNPPVGAVEEEVSADAETSASTIVLATPEPTPVPDAATMASTVVVTPVPTPDAAATASTIVVTPEPTPDAATEASTVVLATPVATPTPTPDAASMASTVVVTPVPVPTPVPDAATGASTVG